MIILKRRLRTETKMQSWASKTWATVRTYLKVLSASLPFQRNHLNRPVFHLSFPVLDLAAAKAFYCGALGATTGRDNGEWVDILLFGHQLTLHNRPDEVLPYDQQGVRHFGVILPWQDWMSLGAKLEKQGCAFLRPPTVTDLGTAHEQGKMLLRDPSSNVIEIKAYRNIATVLDTHSAKA